MAEAQEAFYFLGVALAIGLLIGVERGWQERAAQEGTRIAGVRTYGLIGLLGGVSAWLMDQLGPLFIGFVFLSVAALFITVHVLKLRRGSEDVGITSVVAGMLVFVLGVLAGLGEITIAVAFAVVTTLLLGHKPTLHQWLNKLEGHELQAGLKLLLISAVLLPVLPNEGYGPWQAINPHKVWWMVVLIAAISFVGYFAMKIGGPRHGTVFTGLFGGLAASTAVTLHFSRSARLHKDLTPLLATGILIACGTMLPRMLLVASVINVDLFRLLLVPAVVMALLSYGPAFYYWRKPHSNENTADSPLKNPLELKVALSFGLLLVIIMLLSKALQHTFGEAGVLALAAASGLADVDAITLSLAHLSAEGLSLKIAVTGIVIAAAVNNLFKGGIAMFIGNTDLGVRAGVPLLASAFGGLIAAWLWVWQ